MTASSESRTKAFDLLQKIVREELVDIRGRWHGEQKAKEIEAALSRLHAAVFHKNSIENRTLQIPEAVKLKIEKLNQYEITSLPLFTFKQMLEVRLLEKNGENFEYRHTLAEALDYSRLNLCSSAPLWGKSTTRYNVEMKIKGLSCLYYST